MKSNFHKGILKYINGIKVSNKKRTSKNKKICADIFTSTMGKAKIQNSKSLKLIF